MKLEFLVFPVLLCFLNLSSSQETGKNKFKEWIEILARNDDTPKIKPWDCDSQYFAVMENFNGRVLNHVSYYLQQNGFDPKTMPDQSSTFQATDPNSILWTGSILYYNTLMYDFSKFHPSWKMSVECTGTDLGVTAFIPVSQIQTRNRFKLNIARNEYFGFIDSTIKDYIFQLKYSVDYNDMTVKVGFTFADKGFSNFTVSSNSYDPVMNWTMQSIQNDMKAIFVKEQESEFFDIMTLAFSDAFKNLQINA